MVENRELAVLAGYLDKSVPTRIVTFQSWRVWCLPKILASFQPIDEISAEPYT